MRLVKMSGSGNDFVVLDQEQAAALGSDLPLWIRRVCRRGVSVGADGVLIVGPAAAGRVAVRFFNPDGGEAFCGNGCRCATRYAVLRGHGDSTTVLTTPVGEVPAQWDGSQARVELPPPRDLGLRSLDTADGPVEGRWVDAGVPHFVVTADGPPTAEGLCRIGPPLRRHPQLGEAGANVDLAAPDSQGVWSVRTWERGVEGETLACGTGAVAVAFHASLIGAGEHVRLIPASGIPLEVELPGPPGAPAKAVLTGDARIIFEGEVPEEALAGRPR